MLETIVADVIDVLSDPENLILRFNIIMLMSK